MGVQTAGVIIAMPAMPPAIPSCGMRVISNAGMPMPARRPADTPTTER